MPIILLQGSTKPDGKKIIKNVGEPEKPQDLRKKPAKQIVENVDDTQPVENQILSPSSSAADDLVQKEIASSMADVIDFKVYRVSRPHFVDGTTTVSLVGGELFYNDDEVRHFTTTKTLETGILKQIQSVNSNIRRDRNKKEKKGAKKLLEEESEDLQKEGAEAKQQFPTLLQKVRAFRGAPAKRRGTKSFVLEKILEDNERFRKVKAGQPLWKQVEPPTPEEIISWAIDYVTVNETSLLNIFIQLEENLKKFEMESTT
jgi:hypothetical protein